MTEMNPKRHSYEYMNLPKASSTNLATRDPSKPSILTTHANLRPLGTTPRDLSESRFRFAEIGHQRVRTPLVPMTLIHRTLKLRESLQIPSERVDLFNKDINHPRRADVRIGSHKVTRAPPISSTSTSTDSVVALSGVSSSGLPSYIDL